MHLRICSRKAEACEATGHEVDQAGLDEEEAGLCEALEVLCEPAIDAEPGEGALDDPALGQHLEAGFLEK